MPSIIKVLEENSNKIETELYNDMINVLRDKNISFIDSKSNFDSVKKNYLNSSFYYIRSVDHYKHFSVVGNAVFAQMLKNKLEDLGLVQKTPDYFFANFKDLDVVYMIPQDTRQLSQMQIMTGFDIR